MAIKIEKLKDHKDQHCYMAFLCPGITQQDICESQDNIFVLRSTDSDYVTYAGIVMGHRVGATYEGNLLVEPSHFLITWLGDSYIDVPEVKMLSLMLLEFLVDKSDTMCKYKLTGNESENMLQALHDVGFVPTTDGYYARYARPSDHRIVYRY